MFPARGTLCRGGFDIRPGCSRRRRPGRYGIGPYRGCSTAGFAVSRLAAGLAVGRRGGIYPSRGRLRQRGVRRDEGIPPYGRFIGSAYAGKAACFRCEERHVGADSISARSVCGVAGLPGRDESRPYEQILRFAPPGRPRRFPRFVGEGHGPPAGVCGGAGRADMESAPTGGCSTAGFPVGRGPHPNSKNSEL